MSRLSRCPLAVLALFVLMIAPACGKKGPPLPPLRPAPDAVTDLTVLRREDEVILRFRTPIRNRDGSQPVLFDRVEIYALTVPAGGLSPDPSKVVLAKNRVAQLGHVAAPSPGAAAAGSATPEVAEPVAQDLVFVEKVATVAPPPPTPPTPPVAVPVAPVTDPTAAAAPGAAPVVVGLGVTTRFYMIVPYANRTRVGTNSPLLAVPIGPVPLAPTEATLTYDETTLTLTWTTGAEGQSFRVYDATPGTADTAAPLTVTPLTVATYATPVAFGHERCFTVRGVRAADAGPISLESPASNTACVTPVDTFPPPAPSDLAALASTGSITLTWNGVTAADLAGYIVLRGEGSGDRLQPLMTAPLTGTSFTDTTTRAGVRYVYAVVAVDSATPANRSKESNRVEETGR